MLTQTSGKIDGVLAANDGLGNAAISVLKKNKLNGKVPVTGQDADVQGLQNILAGDQCMTVYKAIKKEADAAAELAIALAKGEQKDTGQTVKDPESGRDVPSVLLDPEGDLQGRTSRTSSPTATSTKARALHRRVRRALRRGRHQLTRTTARTRATRRRPARNLVPGGATAGSALRDPPS